MMAFGSEEEVPATALEEGVEAGDRAEAAVAGEEGEEPTLSAGRTTTEMITWASPSNSVKGDKDSK